MYSGELEVQAKRKAIAVLQDEINRILNASRELATLPELMMKKDKTGIKNTLEQISTIEEEVENLRRKITREVADVGGLIMNRENLLNTAYTMDEIAGYITGISFKLSNVIFLLRFSTSSSIVEICSNVFLIPVLSFFIISSGSVASSLEAFRILLISSCKTAIAFLFA